MDIFERLKEPVGCSCISDLRFEPYFSKARLLLKRQDLMRCSFMELRDLAHYLYGPQSFQTKEALISFLQS